MTERRTETGWFLAAQLALVLCAVMWGPLGARDGGGTSTVLPPLRQAPAESPRQEQAESVRGHEVSSATLRRLALVAVAVVGVLARLRPGPRRWWAPFRSLVPRSPPPLPLGGRAPPLAF